MTDHPKSLNVESLQNASFTVSVSALTKTQTFLEKANEFRLGHLPTETPHPLTVDLSHLAKNDLPTAINILRDVELSALKCVETQMHEIEKLADEIRDTFKTGGRVFFVGCGATGRLSLSLETLWREEAVRQGRPELQDKVFSFIAGGDYALVRSIENFEDHPEYGARQLTDLEFTENDLLIATTEGGETPFVIGATEAALLHSKRSPYFMYCNPTELLSQTVERSRAVIQNPRIRSVALETGPMALAGSTRLQATSALMLAAGSALFSAFERLTSPRAFLDELKASLKYADFQSLVPLIEAESQTYRDGNYCVHRTSIYGITVITDTTERSPTFSLSPFEMVDDLSQPLSWTYLIHPLSNSAHDSWRKLLGRRPRALTWEGFADKYGRLTIERFDFNPRSQERRAARALPHQVFAYDVDCGAREIILKFRGHEARFVRPASQLAEHLLLKCALNISSTLVMGRLGRFEGNLMLYVRAANNKLVDRAIRYVQILLRNAQVPEPSYEHICLALFHVVEGLRPDEPAVLRTFEFLRDQAKEQT